MDLIFHRYADPYTLLDTMIDNQSFDEFVCTFVRLDDDDKLWDMYIHKCWENISFNDFKARLYGTSGGGSQPGRSGAFVKRSLLPPFQKNDRQNYHRISGRIPGG